MRYSAIAPLVSGTQADHDSMNSFFREVSDKGLMPPNGKLRHYSPATIKNGILQTKRTGLTHSFRPAAPTAGQVGRLTMNWAKRSVI